MIKNIVFDMGNVLFTYNPKAYVQSIISDKSIADSVLKELFHEQEWIEIDNGLMTEEQALVHIKKRIPQYEKEVQFAMDHWHESLTPIEGMVGIIERLKVNGYQIYLLSNTSMRFYEYYENHPIFKLFDGLLISAKEKLLKPDTAIFHRLLEMFSLKAEECIFIDDMYPNVDAAISVGFKGYHFDNPKSFLTYLHKQQILDA